MRRRDLIKGLGIAPLAVPAEAARIRATRLDIFTVHVNRRGNWVLARMQTDAGLSGIGEASHSASDGDTIELLRTFFERLKGRTIFDIEWLRQTAAPEITRRKSSAAVALSGLEQCLWDIRGKALGVPACDLFGGRLRDRIRNYANINRAVEDRTPAGFARVAEAAARDGFDAIKLAPFDGMPRSGPAAKLEELTKLGVDCAAAVRQAIGPSRDLLVDAHSRFDLERGLDLLRRVEPLNLYWIEEVTPPEHLPAIRKASRIPTAGGESLYGVRGFYPYIAAGSVGIVMPDVKYCGGMLELKKIAAMVEGAGLAVSPHGPASPVGNLAAAHVCAGLPNCEILELAYGEVPWRAELIDPQEQLAGGRMILSDRPGLGATLNEKTLRKYQI